MYQGSDGQVYMYNPNGVGSPQPMAVQQLQPQGNSAYPYPQGVMPAPQQQKGQPMPQGVMPPPQQQMGQPPPNGQAVVPVSNGKRDWNSGLCGCFSNCSVCLCSYICPCYVVGQNAEFLGDDRMIYTVAAYCLPLIAQFFVRLKIRQKLNIAGSEPRDCITIFCCQPCALAQERREVLDAMGEGKQTSEDLERQ